MLFTNPFYLFLLLTVLCTSAIIIDSLFLSAIWCVWKYDLTSFDDNRLRVDDSSSIVSSVTRWKNKKQPNFPKTCPKSNHINFYLKSHAFQNSLCNICATFAIKFVTKIFQKYPSLVTLIVMYSETLCAISSQQCLLCISTLDSNVVNYLDFAFDAVNFRAVI